MYASVIALGSLLAAQAVVADNTLQLSHVLSKRQDQSFVPDTTPGCPSGWPMCGTSNVCYSPSRGDTCCPDGTWACPSGTFCLQQGRCCPDGIDPETCAENEGITLTSSSTSEPTSAPQPTESQSSTSSRPVIPTGTTSTGAPTGTPPASSSPAPPEFTGGANTHLVGGAAAVLGGLGMIGNLVL
ncbi:hypothetical protein ASPSYDRAFT_92325 [Aspergillus sydowii CBS 593.65]|uniref:Granulins domain-containing protein n=1 Tax=Aspergillus sydowii CBS 593.65 TaxID=1036612 RepID=A0A1L9T9N9_9EURO|nr:uncharacterized protein ASPSYDRAFT_92325 [Aspergillus sydowii CBS 593.65]OJJ56132.1 hypothetical protein ASPSYDRAFT_92325 [Aspergillus sydowii CBS 593.65]